MAHTFNHLGTPGYPAPPHPTPSSDHRHPSGLFNPKIPRPPVQNPFDKFSQNDFDAWIGKLTGDLEKALGYEEIDLPQASSSAAPHEAKQLDDGDAYFESDSYVEDSFAEVKARRVLDKGKARDPREGPGLGPKHGDKEKPIEILSEESEDEEEEQILQFEGSDVGEQGEGEYGEEYEEEEEEQEEGSIEDLVRVREDHSRRQRRVESDMTEEEMEDVHLIRPADKRLELGEGGVDDEEEEYDEDEERKAEGSDGQSSDEVIELLSDNEAGPGPSTANQQREEEEEFLSDEEDANPWSSPALADGDLEEGNDLEDQRDEIVQPSDEDTSFPPHPTNTLVDLRDPWAQVNKYAEDYYAGGEVIPDVKGRLSAHHLGVNDDGSGFLTPDVVNPESEGEEEEGEEEDEYEENYEDLEAKEAETEEFDENDHLFNRLRSYTQHKSFVYSALRGPRTGFVARTGPGSNEEPILIDSDEEAEEAIPVARKPEIADKEKLEEDHTAEEHPEEVATVAVDTERGKEADVEPEEGYQSGVSEEIRNEPTIPSTAFRIQEPEQYQSDSQQVHEGVQHPVQSADAAEAPSQTLFLPTPPTEPSGLPGAPATADAGEDKNAINMLYDGIKTSAPTHDLHDARIEGRTDPAKDLPDWSLGFSSGPPDSHSHNLIDVPSATPGLPHGLSTMSANVDAEVFGFEQMATHFEFSGHTTADAHTEMHTSGGSAFIEAVIDEEAADEVDELDESDEPGTLPLMTSDLEYPIEDGAVMSKSLKETSHEPFGTLAAEGKPSPSEMAEVGDDQQEDVSGVQIVVEEPEDYYPGTPPEQITINVEAATPLAVSRQSSPAVVPGHEFIDSPASPEQACITEVICDSVVSEPVSIVASSISQGSVSEKDEGSADPITIIEDEHLEASMPEFATLTSADEPLTTGEILEDAETEATDISITVEQETITLGEGQLAYTIEEPVTDSEYRGSEGPDRGVSIGVASVQFDEIMPSMVETGDVEEVPSDAELEEGKEAAESHAEVETTKIVEEVEDADVRNAQSPSEAEIDRITITPAPVDTHTAASTTPEVVSNDYFAQPASPAMPPTNLDVLGHTNFPASTPNGSLPSIIQLPGTPQRVLSPASTPAPGPTPVSIAVEPVVLKALKENPALFSGIASPPAPTSQQSLRSSTTEVAFIAATANSVETSTVAQTSTSDISLLPVTTTSPRKTTLYEDPFPYSLSTPGPRLEENEEGSEEDTEQDNSLSSSSSGDKELEEAGFGNAVDLELHYPVEESPEARMLTPDAEIDAMVERVLETEKGLVDVEAEADALIDQFLVDEPESDTDADGEADPEFVGLESSVSTRSSEEIVVKEFGESTPLVVDIVAHENETPAKTAEVLTEVKDAPVKVNEVSRDVEGAPAKEDEVAQVKTDREEDEQDPFKLMGNDSLVAPGETLEMTPSEKPWAGEEEKNESEAGAVEYLNSQLAPTNETTPKTPSVEVVPMSPLRIPSSGRPSSPSRSGYVGVLPYHAAAAAYMKHYYLPPLQQRPHIPGSLPSLGVTAPVEFRQQKEENREASNLAPEHTDVFVQVPSLAAAVSTHNKQEAFPEPKVEGSPRKIHISVEDPYNADNDTDREQGSKASRPGKRKRSLSEVSNDELSPITPKSASAARGKGKASRSTAKGSRPRKESSKKINPFSSNVASRSPSVASTAVSDTSSFAQLSPSYLSLPSSDPRPFIHAHSRRKRGNAPTTVQQQLHKQLHKSNLGTRSQGGLLRAEDVLTKAPTSSSASTSSPMTRSHCRYHKISIPKTENGPRINFLVPGCSLNDAKLIEEEEIEDQGEAIIRGDTRIADDIETINFEPYLLWAMRQLVGTELLRENEVFYLPEPDEIITRNLQDTGKKKGTRPSKKRSKLVDENSMDPSQIPAVRHSPSRASSVASSASVLQQIIGGSDIEDLSTVTETEEDKSSPAKSQGKRFEEGTNEPNISPMKGEASALSRKRGRRLGQDAAAYHPSTDDDSSTDFSDHNTGRKSTRGRGLKRPRASEASIVEGMGTGTEGRKIKKLKTQPSLTPSQTLIQVIEDQPQIHPSQPHPNPQTESQSTPLEGTINSI